MKSQDLTCFCKEPPMMTRKLFMRSRARTLIYVPDDGPRYIRAMIPLRLLLFILTFMLFTTLIYMVSLASPGIAGAPAVFVISMSSIYLFFDVIHIIGYFSDSQTVEYPMIFGSLIGIFIFTVMGGVMCFGVLANSWGRMLGLVLCFVISYLHLADCLLALGYWRHKYPNRRKCGPPPDAMTTIGTGNGVGDGYSEHFQRNNTYIKSDPVAASSTLPPLQTR